MFDCFVLCVLRSRFTRVALTVLCNVCVLCFFVFADMVSGTCIASDVLTCVEVSLSWCLVAVMLLICYREIVFLSIRCCGDVFLVFLC